MDASLLLVTAVVLILLGLFVKRYGRFLYLTTKIPGPSLWDFVLIHAKELLSDNMIYHIQKITEAYGHRPWGMWTFRGFIVFVSDCDTVRDVYKSKSLYNKPSVFYRQMSYYLGQGLIVSNGEQYKRHRKIAGPAFRKSAVDTHLPVMNTLAVELIETLRGLANGKEVDVRYLIGKHVASMSLWMFSGGELVYDSSVLSLFSVLESGRREVQVQALNPPYYYLWHRFKKSSQETEKRIAEAKAEFAKLYEEGKIHAVEKMRQNPEKKITCVLDTMIREYLTKGQYETVDEEGRAGSLTVVAASQDATSFVMNVTLVLIALHRDVQRRIFEEIYSIFGGSLRPVELEDLSNMNYLDMAIKESLRMFPAGPLIARAAEEDVNIGGVTVPKGCTVALNIMGLHRNPDIFKDPLKYDPGRFSPELCEGRNSYAFIPLSAGFRNCPGQLQAWLMLKTTLCYIFIEFEVLPGSGLKTVDDVRPKMYFSLHLEKSPLRFVKRCSA